MISFLKQKPFRIVFSLLSVIFVVFAVVLFIPKSSPAAPVITWTPAPITETVSPGGSKMVNVTFTSSKNLSNVTVWIVPELQPFVQVQPVIFNQITKGQTTNLTLTISANIDSPLGTFDGTIHLRIGSKTYPQTLKVLVKIVTPQTIMSDFQKAALEDNVDMMVESFHPSIKDTYRDAFNQAKTTGLLDELVNMLQTAQLVYEKEDYAKFSVYIIENDRKIVSYIYMVKDINGTWVIKSL